MLICIPSRPFKVGSFGLQSYFKLTYASWRLVYQSMQM